MKNAEKIFRFWDKSVWSCFRKSGVNVLANSLKIYDQSKAVFLQLNLPEIHGKTG